MALEIQQLLLSSILQLGHAKLRTLYYYPRRSDDRLYAKINFAKVSFVPA